MNTFKRTLLFLLVMFVAPLSVIIGIGCFIHQNDAFIPSILTSIATSLIAAGVVYWFIDKRLKDLIETDDEITIVLESPNGEKIECPPMSRKDFKRQEVMGYIGMITGQGNFKMNSKRSFKLVNQIRDIQKTKGDQILEIICSDEEIEKFENN